ncbi:MULTISPECIES: hypothetical protein [unclassified Moorena]|nr:MULTISPECIES: hypothetical protein [unclassified Moorena]
MEGWGGWEPTPNPSQEGKMGRWGDGNPPLTPPRRGRWGDRGDFY